MCILSYVIREYYDQPAGSSVDNSDFFPVCINREFNFATCKYSDEPAQNWMLILVMFRREFSSATPVSSYCRMLYLGFISNSKNETGKAC